MPSIIKNSFIEFFLNDIIPTVKENRLKNKHWVSIRTLLESTTCHGVKANNKDANNPGILPYNKFPNLYTNIVHPKLNIVIKVTPVSNDEPNILKKKTSM